MADVDWALRSEIGEQVFGGGDHGVGLLEALRLAGLSVGPREQVAVAALLTQLIADTPDDENGSASPLQLGDIAPQLAPLLARSPDEREIFFRIFEALKPSWRDRIVRSISVGPSTSAPLVDTPNAVKRTGARWVAGLVVCCLLAGGVVSARWLRPHPRPQTQTSQILAPQAPPVVAAPAPTQPSKDELPSVDRIRVAAEAYDGAPTLAELSAELAKTSPIGWSKEAYTERLHELTGLPRHEPLGLAGIGSAWRIESLILSLDVLENHRRIEVSGRLSGLDQILQLSKLLTERMMLRESGRAEKLASHFNTKRHWSPSKQVTIAEVQRDLAGRPDILKHLGVKSAKEVRPDTIERALAISPDPQVRHVWPDAPWRRPLAKAKPPTSPWWVFVCAVVLPFLIAAAWMANAILFRKAHLRQRRPAFPPTHMDLLAEAKARAGVSFDLFHRAAERLSRRTPKSTDRLDIERTVDATVRAGGLIVQPVFGATSATAEYLVLIERRSSRDHDYERLRDMVETLRRTQILPIELYSYDLEPSLLDPEAGGRLATLDTLASKFPEHRLIVLGTGEAFLEPRTGKARNSAAKLALWARRALLTPLPMSEWAQEEFDLARELEMPIGRATPEGFLALADLLGLEGVEPHELVQPIGDGLATAMPEIFRLRGDEFLYEVPPDDQPVEQTVRHLRNYLDGAAYHWLCALCVYPAVQWDLTIYLGVVLNDPWSQAPLYSERGIAAIAQLPWFRAGHIPNWLRRALIATMPKDFEGDVRTAINRLLAEAEERDDPVENDRIRFRISQEPNKEPLPPNELMSDEVLLDFLSRGDPNDFRPDRQDINRKPDRARGLDPIHIAIALIAVTYAAAAFIATPQPWAGPLITGAWAPLGLLVLGAVIGLSLVQPRGTYGVVRARLEVAGPYGLLFAVVTGLSWGLRFAPIVGAPPWALPTTGLLGAALLPLAREIAHRLGGYLPDAKRPALRMAGILVAGLFAVLAGFVVGQAGSPVGLGLSVTAGLVLFGLGVAAARYAPASLPPPSAKKALSEPTNLWLGAGRAAVMAAAAIPAVWLAIDLQNSHPRVPPELAPGFVGHERIVATSQDGRYFVTGDTAGSVSVFDSAKPRRALWVFPVGGLDRPVISLAIEHLSDGTLNVAAAALGGSVKLYDVEKKRSHDLSFRSYGVRPLIALSPKGGWAVAWIDEKGAAKLTTNTGGPPLPLPIVALAPTDMAGRWVVAFSDGRLALATDAGLSFAIANSPNVPEVRLPSRARSLSIINTRLRAIGEDGSILEADVSAKGLTSARIHVDPRLRIAPPIQMADLPTIDFFFPSAKTIGDTCPAYVEQQGLAKSDIASADSTPFPNQDEIKYFWPEDGSTAADLAGRLSACGLKINPKTNVVLITGDRYMAAAPHNYFEVWIGKSDPIPAPAPPLAQAQTDTTNVRGTAPSSKDPISTSPLTTSATLAQITTSTKPGTVFRDMAKGVPDVKLPQMVLIPAGSFVMGSPESEAGRFNNEGPRHRVTIGRAFAVGKYDVTFDEWSACVSGGGCNSNPNPSDAGFGRGDRPVINVNWEDAQGYVSWLSKVTGQSYRLLTEAEWEYAARAGTDTAYSFGNDASQLGAYGWYAKNSNARTHPVGQKLPNGFGLYDVHGNVWQWVQDCYSDSYAGASMDGSANTTKGCDSRVLRGGSWVITPQNLRSANRDWYTPSGRYNFYGFRVARTLSPP